VVVTSPHSKASSLNVSGEAFVVVRIEASKVSNLANIPILVVV